MKNFKLLLIFLLLFIGRYSFALDNIEVGFSPSNRNISNKGVDLVLKVINNAKSTLHIAAYSFTSKKIALAIVDAKKRGVDIKVVADKKANSGRYTAVTYLANNNVPVALNDRYAIFHNKFIIADGKTLETGSFNYTQAAEKSNAENVIVFWNNVELSNKYEELFSIYWSEATLLKANY